MLRFDENYLRKFMKQKDLQEKESAQSRQDNGMYVDI